jgi:geranylgeranyl diphosphate synthase type I
LIHDDVEDQSDLRRGRPTLWKLWGVPQAINAGDALYTIAHSAVHRLHDRSVPAERVIAAHRHFSQTCLHLTQGQFLDLSYETRDDVGAEDYLLMIGGKTAALVSGAAALGAIVAGSDRVDDYAAFGRGLGLAFQIQDDLLGIWGDPGVTGKSAATDILSRKKSLPVLFGLENSEALRELYAAPRLDVPRIVALLEEVGAKAFAEQMAGDYTQRAAVALDAAQPQGNAGDLLRALTISLLGRQA